jgi:hypothetical protein
VLWETVSAHFDLLVSRLDVRSLERRSADTEGINNDPDGPNIDLIGMSAAILLNLWCNVIGSAANRVPFFGVELKLGRQSEITNFKFHFIRLEEISQFKISVNNSISVQIFDTIDQLKNVGLDFNLH